MRCANEACLLNLLFKLAIFSSISTTSIHAQPTAVTVSIGFDQESVNASEGNIAVVCATAMFLNNTPSMVTVNVSLVNTTNSPDQMMKAGICGCSTVTVFC